MLSVHHVNPLKDRHFQYNIASRLKSLFKEKLPSWQNYALRCIIPQVFGLLIDIFYHVERTGESQTFNVLLLLAYDIHSTSYPNTPNLCVLKLNCSHICSSILHYPYAASHLIWVNQPSTLVVLTKEVELAFEKWEKASTQPRTKHSYLAIVIFYHSIDFGFVPRNALT